jgi:hypothetical protein
MSNHFNTSQGIIFEYGRKVASRIASQLALAVSTKPRNFLKSIKKYYRDNIFAAWLAVIFAALPFVPIGAIGSVSIFVYGHLLKTFDWTQSVLICMAGLIATGAIVYSMYKIATLSAKRIVSCVLGLLAGGTVTGLLFFANPEHSRQDSSIDKMGNPSVSRKADGSIELTSYFEEGLLLERAAPQQFTLSAVIESDDEFTIGFVPIATTSSKNTAMSYTNDDAFVVTVKPKQDFSTNEPAIIKFRRWNNRNDSTLAAHPMRESARGKVSYVVIEVDGDQIEVRTNNETVVHTFPAGTSEKYRGIFISAHPIPGFKNMRAGHIKILDWALSPTN